MSGLGLFEGFGVELEYMIVSRDSLEVLPAADRILVGSRGEPLAEIEAGPLCWSNELALHVIELKTNGPAHSLEPLAGVFDAGVRCVNERLEAVGGRLMPTAMHPWMDPLREVRLWPHDNSPIYQAYDRIFGCRGHGWANLQSLHLNLPFCGEEEFGRLHAAIRLVLPLLPALAASSPLMDGRLTGLLDNRLEVYRNNQRRIPSITGRVIPEPVYTPAAYQMEILQRIYGDVAPHDPAGVLQYEWLNSRGAIARFDRDTIEIRVLDVQECPRADLAIAVAVVAVLKALIGERWAGLAEQQGLETRPLEALLLSAIRHGEAAPVDDRAYLSVFGFPGKSCSLGELWQHLVARLLPDGSGLDAGLRSALDVLLARGPLARRILKALGGEASPDDMRALYRRLCDCLAGGEMFCG